MEQPVDLPEDSVMVAFQMAEADQSGKQSAERLAIDELRRRSAAVEYTKHIYAAAEHVLARREKGAN